MQKLIKSNIKSYYKPKSKDSVNHKNKLKLKKSKVKLDAIEMVGRPSLNFGRTDLSDYTFLSCTVVQNNMFIVLQKLKDSNFQLLNLGNPEKYEVEGVTRRTVKQNAKYTVSAFFNELYRKKITLPKNIGLKIVAPHKAKKTLLRLFTRAIRKRNFRLEIEPRKIFNGCRARKPRRKKRRGLRIFK